MNGPTVASLGFREGVAHTPSQIRVRSRVDGGAASRLRGGPGALRLGVRTSGREGNSRWSIANSRGLPHLWASNSFAGEIYNLYDDLPWRRIGLDAVASSSLALGHAVPPQSHHLAPPLPCQVPGGERSRSPMRLTSRNKRKKTSRNMCHPVNRPRGPSRLR
jgi:hypothetical protein